MFMESSVIKILSERGTFNEFVYTPLDEAIKELQRRANDESVPNSKNPIKHFNGELRAAIFRHIATPNYEIRRFLSLIDGTEILKPIILEYLDDKFTNLNEWKYSLGKMSFYKGRDSKGNLRLDSKSIIDFNTSNGKPLSSIQTLWGQSLVDFHHEKFARAFPHLNNSSFDISKWLKENGSSAKSYYVDFFKIFIKHGILFENFLLDGPELEFTKKVILPAILKVIEETGFKPLIVSLEPTEVEGDHFWLCHPFEDKEFVINKMRKGV